MIKSKCYHMRILVVVQLLSHVWLCDPMDCSMPGFPVFYYIQESAQTHVHWVSDAIQPSHPLSSPSPPALNLSQHQGLFQWVDSSHQVTKVLELLSNFWMILVIFDILKGIYWIYWMILHLFLVMPKMTLHMSCIHAARRGLRGTCHLL